MKRKFDRNNSDYSLAHVLYQKLGTDWYAFTEVDGDCFMTKVNADALEQANKATEQGSGSSQSRSNNSKRRAA